MVEAGDEVCSIELGALGRVARLSSALQEEHFEVLANLLSANQDCFTWCEEDLSSVDPSLAIHELYVDQTRQLVHQQLYKKSLEQWEAATQKVNRLLRARFIEEAHFPS